MEEDINSFQQKVAASIFTYDQAQTRNAALQNRQNDLNSFAQQKRAEIKQKSDAVNNEILALIQDYVSRLNAGGRYSMILATQAAGGVDNCMLYLPVVTANPSLDI
ncbi:MAG: OmpH family outer membrane protein [Bacteroidales bacterium]|nr:OmpH family outer membrane protein [Bacteroidales bacterium]